MDYLYFVEWDTRNLKHPQRLVVTLYNLIPTHVLQFKVSVDNDLTYSLKDLLRELVDFVVEYGMQSFVCNR